MTTLRERIQARIAVLRERSIDSRTWSHSRYVYGKIAGELEGDLLESEPPTIPLFAADPDEVTR